MELWKAANGLQQPSKHLIKKKTTETWQELSVAFYPSFALSPLSHLNGILACSQRTGLSFDWKDECKDHAFVWASLEIFQDNKIATQRNFQSLLQAY